MLRDPGLGRSGDPDLDLWRLPCVADGHGLPPASDGLGAWALAMWMLVFLRFSRFPGMDVGFFGCCLRAVRQMVWLYHVGRLACWRRRMDEAHCPRDALDDAPRPTPARHKCEVILDPIHEQHRLLAPFIHAPLYVPHLEFRYVMIKANEWFGSCIYSAGAVALVTATGGSSILGCICGLRFLHGSCRLIQLPILFWAIWPPGRTWNGFCTSRAVVLSQAALRARHAKHGRQQDTFN